MTHKWFIFLFSSCIQALIHHFLWFIYTSCASLQIYILKTYHTNQRTMSSLSLRMFFVLFCFFAWEVDHYWLYREWLSGCLPSPTLSFFSVWTNNFILLKYLCMTTVTPNCNFLVWKHQNINKGFSSQWRTDRKAMINERQKTKRERENWAVQAYSSLYRDGLFKMHFLLKSSQTNIWILMKMLYNVSLCKCHANSFILIEGFGRCNRKWDDVVKKKICCNAEVSCSTVYVSTFVCYTNTT